MNEYLKECIDTLHCILGENIALIPCEGKRAFLRGWNKLTAADMAQDYLAHFPGPNIGLVCGQNSDDLCALDIDDEALKKFLTIFPEARNWPTLCGQRGAKLFVQVRGSYPLKHKLFLAGKAWGDWLAGGAYAVVCGVHPDTGQPYRWERIAPVPELRFDAILQVLTRLGVGRKSNPRSKKPSLLPRNATTTSNSSAICTLHPAPCALHDTSSAEDMVTRISSRMRVNGMSTRRGR